MKLRYFRFALSPVKIFISKFLHSNVLPFICIEVWSKAYVPMHLLKRQSRAQ